MPKERPPSLESPTARKDLPVSKKPVWVRLGVGVALGYRKNNNSGTWSVRGTGWIKRIAIADDNDEPVCAPAVLNYWQAVEEARKFVRQRAGGPVDESRPVTVGEALDRYAADLRANGGNPYNAKRPRLHLPASILAKPASLLGATELKSWRNGLIAKMKPASVNRTMKCLAAALNLAAEHDPRIQNQRERKTGLRGLPGATVARNVILSDDQVRAFVAEARERGLGLLVEVLAVTGTRPSQAARLCVADLLADPPRLLVPRSGKGGGDRVEKKTQTVPVPITAALALRLKQSAAGRPGDAPLLLRANGTAWAADPSYQYRRDVREVVTAIGLDPDVVTMYSLRHSSIVRGLLLNVPIRVIASTHDTSVAMIEKHYSKHIAAHSDQLSRAALLQDAPIGGNVVAIAGR